MKGFITTARNFVRSVFAAFIGTQDTLPHEPAAPSDKPDNFRAHMELIGHLASEWNRLELHINYYIWELANVEKLAGACITAQIIPPSSRMRALISLAQYCGASKKLIEKLGKFSVTVEALARRRNRYIHDPWMIQGTPDKVVRLEIVNNRTLVFEFKPENRADLEALIRDIRTAMDRVEELRTMAGTEIPAFDRTTFLRSQGISLPRHRGSRTSSPPEPPPQPEPSPE